MAPPKKPAPKPKPRAKASPPAPKKIQAVEWYDFASASRYLMSLFSQMGKLGLAAPGEDDHSLAPFHRDVLSEIMRWRDEHPNEAYDHLVNWRNLDVERIVQRQQTLPRHETAKPRIEISVDVNRKDNLIVRWYPAGFFDRRPRYTRGRHYTPNLLDDCDFEDQPDFRWFVGDETGSWAPRPSNELMFIRGVGNIRIWEDDPRWGPHYGVAAVNALLIYAVRASFNAMVEGLRRTHEVTLLDDFVFEFDEVDVPDAPIPLMAKRNVLRSWKIVETPRPKKPERLVLPPGETGQVLQFRPPSEPSG